MRKMKNICLLMMAVALCNLAFAESYTLEGRITSVFAGGDSWYGVRLYMDKTIDNSGDNCDSTFAYTEPKTGNGHSNMVSVFLAGYMAGKKVRLTVIPGRNNYCQIVEGAIKD